MSIDKLEARVAALEVTDAMAAASPAGGGVDSDDAVRAALAAERKSTLARLKQIRAVMAAEDASPATGSGDVSAETAAELEALRAENAALRAENTKLDYRVEHLVREMKALVAKA